MSLWDKNLSLEEIHPLCDKCIYSYYHGDEDRWYCLNDKCPNSFADYCSFCEDCKYKERCKLDCEYENQSKR